MPADTAALNATANLATAVRAYSEAVRSAHRNDETLPNAFTGSSDVTPTDVAIVVDALLRAANMDLFEIQMWRSLGSA